MHFVIFLRHLTVTKGLVPFCTMCAMGLKMNGNGTRLDRGMGRTPRFSPWWLPYEIFNAPTGQRHCFYRNATVDAAVPSRRAGVVVRRQDTLFFFISSTITLSSIHTFVLSSRPRCRAQIHKLSRLRRIRLQLSFSFYVRIAVT